MVPAHESQGLQSRAVQNTCVSQQAGQKPLHKKSYQRNHAVHWLLGHEQSPGACALALATNQGSMVFKSKQCMRAHARDSLLLRMLSQILHSKLCVLRVHLYTGPRRPSHLSHGTHRSHPAGRGQRKHCSTQPGCSHYQGTTSWLGSAHPLGQRPSQLRAAADAGAGGSTCPASSGSAPAAGGACGHCLAALAPPAWHSGSTKSLPSLPVQKVRAGGWP